MAFGLTTQHQFSSMDTFFFTLPPSSSSSSSSPLPPLPNASFSAFSTTSSLPPQSSPPSPPCTLDDWALRLPLAFLYSLFFLIGLLGNLLALWVFLFLHGRRNSVRVFLINVAVADLVLLACLPFRVVYHAMGNRWVLSSLACKVVGNLFYMNMYVSITLLGFISLDRYVRLKGRGRGRAGALGRRLCRGRSCGWSWALCGALWLVSLAGLVPMAMTGEGNEEEGKCFQYKQRLGARAKAYFNMALVGLFWAVFLLLVVSYGKIAARLLRVSGARPDMPNAQRYGRTARKSFFVLFLFTVCFGPYHAFRPVYVLSQLSQSLTCDYMRLMDRTNEVMLLFSAFNSCLDPVMYFLLSGSVRKAVVRALGDRFSNRLTFLKDGTSNSSTTEFRRASVCPPTSHAALYPSLRTSLRLLDPPPHPGGASPSSPSGPPGTNDHID